MLEIYNSLELIYVFISFGVGATTYIMARLQDRKDKKIVQNLAVKTALQFAITKFVNRRKEYEDVIKFIIAKIKISVGSREIVQLVEIKTIMEEHIPWDKLDTAETLVARNLIEVIMRSLEKQYSQGLIIISNRGYDIDVFEWISEALETP
jgi:hypothetical protein